MFSFRLVLILFIVALISLVGSTNGQHGCDSSSSRDEMYDEQSREYSEGSDRMNRINLDCGGGSHGNSSGSEMIIEISVGLFFLIWVVVGICVVFCTRSKMAVNAAAVKPYAGEVGARELQGYGMDEKTKTVPMSVPKGDTNV